MGSATDLLEALGDGSSDDYCGSKDLLDLLDVVANALVEKGGNSCECADAFVACGFGGIDRRQLAALCLGHDQRSNDRGGVGILHQSVFQYVVRCFVVW